MHPREIVPVRPPEKLQLAWNYDPEQHALAFMLPQYDCCIICNPKIEKWGWIPMSALEDAEKRPAGGIEEFFLSEMNKDLRGLISQITNDVYSGTISSSSNLYLDPTVN